MYNTITKLLFFLALCCIASAARGQSVRFRILTKSRIAQCGEKGFAYKTGEVSAPEGMAVNVQLYLQMQDGTWQKFPFSHTGSGELALNLEDCGFTGNHYAYICETSKQCNFPSVEEIARKHKQKPQSPSIKVKPAERVTCTDGKPGFRFSQARVYSPTGQAVEIILFLEKKDGRWRKKHYSYEGTGFLELNAEGSDLTGNHKTMVQYKR